VREFSSDVHYDIDDIIAEGEKVAVRMTHSGTHTGAVRVLLPGQGFGVSSLGQGDAERGEHTAVYLILTPGHEARLGACKEGDNLRDLFRFGHST
jgi:SnoaL-like polyketide cyclase